MTQGNSADISRGRSEVSRSGRLGLRSSMLPYADRRKLLAEVDHRGQHLWALSHIITASLAFGIALILYPELHVRVQSWRIHLQTLPQLVAGLLVLVVLSGIYIFTKQRELTALRNLIIASYMAAASAQDAYSRDPLTGAVDRSALPDVIKEESARADRTHGSLCLILFDIRHFHTINEREGNLAGDLVLKELALALRRTARQTDLVLRYGSDEFLCLLVATPLQGGECFIRRVLDACGRVPRLRSLTLDTGAVLYQTGSDPDVLLAEAEGRLALQKVAATPGLAPGAPRPSAVPTS